MKTLKIKLVGFYDGFNPDNFLMFKILGKYYNVVFSDDPDYIICSESQKPYEYCKYPQVRIMYSGENYIPDLNLVDYAICNYPVKLLDRCFYLPLCVGSNSGHGKYLDGKERNYSHDILKEKEYFANLICSHDSEYQYRSRFFERLSQYKRVESPGTFMNNMPDGRTVEFKNESKIEFQRKCKFTICFESTKHEGFVTEKIADAFYADTIPIFYGSSTVKDIFNRDAFVNIADYDSFDDAVERIIELDQDDEQYLEMLSQPVFVKQDYVSQVLDDYEAFLRYIFDQPVNEAYRRSRVYVPARYNDYFRKLNSGKEKIGKERKRRLSIRRIISRLRK